MCVCMRETIYESLSELFDILTPETGGYENLQYDVNKEGYTKRESTHINIYICCLNVVLHI